MPCRKRSRIGRGFISPNKKYACNDKKKVVVDQIILQSVRFHFLIPLLLYNSLSVQNISFSGGVSFLFVVAAIFNCASAKNVFLKLFLLD